MPSNFTQNYNLNQWEATDRILRTDFNADNAKIDAAIKAQADALAGEKTAREAAVRAVNTTISGLVKVEAGFYTGDGKESRTISLGFTPKAVLVVNSNGYMYINSGFGASYYGGLALEGHLVGNPSFVILEIVSGGFKVGYKINSTNGAGIRSNQSGENYHYIALY